VSWTTFAADDALWLVPVPHEFCLWLSLLLRSRLAVPLRGRTVRTWIERAFVTLNERSTSPRNLFPLTLCQIAGQRAR